jgi:hypothetical protein
MKPQELRLNNYVADKRYKTPMYIVSMGLDEDRSAYLYLEFDGNEGDVWENYLDEIMPLPIKDYEDLLERFGFEYNEAERKHRALLGGYNVTLIRKGNKYALAIEECEEVGYFFDVAYIHELQNIIFDTIEISLQ